MDTATILNKLRFKDSLKSVVINAPTNIDKELKKAGLQIERKSDKYHFTLSFVRDKAEFDKFIRSTIDQLEYDSVFWIAYPKGTSSIKSDLNRDKFWPLLKPFGLRPVSQIAVDNDWSALRFRPVEKVNK